jgi:hypothetical protein
VASPYKVYTVVCHLNTIIVSSHSMQGVLVCLRYPVWVEALRWVDSPASESNKMPVNNEEYEQYYLLRYNAM